MGNKISIARRRALSPSQIKMQLLRRGYSVKTLAEKIDRPVPTVSTAINHKDRFPRVKQQILEVLYV